MDVRGLFKGLGAMRLSHNCLMRLHCKTIVQKNIYICLAINTHVNKKLFGGKYNGDYVAEIMMVMC